MFLICQDAVAKGTYEMLPGCATVVLETVVAIQSFAVNKVSQALRASVSDNQKSQRFTIKYEYYFELFCNDKW